MSKKPVVSAKTKAAFVAGKGVPFPKRSNPIEAITSQMAQDEFKRRVKEMTSKPIEVQCPAKPACDITPQAPYPLSPLERKNGEHKPLEVQYDYEQTEVTREVLSCLSELHTQFPRYWSNRALLTRKLLALAVKVSDRDFYGR